MGIAGIAKAVKARRAARCPRTPAVLKFASDFSGMDTAAFALKRLGVKARCDFASDTSNPCQRLLKIAHSPMRVFKDVALRAVDELPNDIDVYAFTPPCTTFSAAGKHEGVSSPIGRLYQHSVQFIRERQPKVVFYENVLGMCRGRHKATLITVRNELREAGYHVEVRVLDARLWHVPQRRRRVILVGLRQDVVKRKFVWPRPCTAVSQPKLSAILDPVRPADKAGRLPAHSRERALVKKACDAAFQAGHNPLQVPVVIDVDCSARFACHVVNQAPTLTRCRGARGGHWVSTRGRRMTPSELLRLQGFKPSEVPWREAKLSACQLGAMLGNGISLPVAAVVLRELLLAANLISKSKYLRILKTNLDPAATTGCIG